MSQPVEIKNIMIADDIQHAKSFLENYQPVKINNEWYPATVVIYEDSFPTPDEAWKCMRANLSGMPEKTIQLGSLDNNQYAYLFLSSQL